MAQAASRLFDTVSQLSQLKLSGGGFGGLLGGFGLLGSVVAGAITIFQTLTNNVGKASDALRDELGSAARETAEQLRNVPTILKVTGFRGRSSNPTDLNPRLPFDNDPSGPGRRGQDDGFGDDSGMGDGGVVVTIENMTVADGAEFVKQLKEAIQREVGLGGNSALG